MDGTFGRGPAVGVGVVVALLILNGGLTFRNTYQLDEDARWVAHTHKVLDTLADLNATLQQAQAAQRSFLVTDDRRRLEPLDDASRTADEQIDGLQRLTKDNTRQQDRIPALRGAVTRRLDRLKEVARARQQEGPDAARRSIESDEEEKTSQELRGIIGEMGREERELLRGRETATARAYLIAVTTGLLTALLGLAAVVTSALLLRRHLRARLRAAAAIQWERERFRITLASIGDAVIVTDARGRVTFLNAVAGALTGWTEGALGRELPEVFRIENEQTGEAIESPASKVLREGTVVGLGNHTVLISRDGSRRPIDDSGAPLREATGQVSGVVLVFRDVTERRQLERLQRDLHAELERQVEQRTEQLRRSEEHFRLLVEGTTDYAIFMLDPRGRVVSWNPGAERINGYAAAEIVGQHFSRFYPSEDVEGGKPKRELEIAAAGGRYEEEGWRVRKDGSRFWSSVLITALRDEGGRLRGFSKITRDMTLRKEAEENARRLAEERAARQAAEAGAQVIREQRERLRVTLESIGDAVIATDAAGRVALLNPVARALTGWATEEAAGQPLEAVFDIKNEQTGRPAENPVGRVLREGVVVGLANHTVLTARDGTVRPIEDSAAPIKDETGRTVGVVLVFHDVTEKRASENALRRTYAELQEADRRKDEFLAMLAHELRNPLAPLRNAVCILRLRGVDAATAERAKDMMERQIRHMVRLVDDLLDVARIMQGKIELRKEPVDIATIVARAVETAQPAIDAQGHQLTVSLPPEPVSVDADPMRLAQVVGNLLTNSAKYMEGGGRIRLDAARQGEELVLRVRDAGIGIAPEFLPRIFDLFVQAEHGVGRAQGGLGVGLTLVRRLVEMHGGSVTAHSDGVGKGSEFVVRLPAIPQGREAVRPGTGPREVLPGPHPPRRRVLVVDDNVDAADSLAVLLRHQGQEVRVAHDGPSALDAARTDPPQMVFLDIGLPGMDGYEVARRMRSDPALAGVKLVALTGYGQEEDRRRSKEAGFDLHLVKPADPVAVERLLGV